MIYQTKTATNYVACRILTGSQTKNTCTAASWCITCGLQNHLVWRNGLLYKLIRHSISSKMKKMIGSIYANVKSCMKKVNGELSDKFQCELGLRQCCVLSPLLFSLFINDLDDEIRSTNTKGCKLFDTYIHTLSYANDLVLFAESKDELQLKIDKLGEFCSKWELVVGLPRTKVMIFGGGYNAAKLKETISFSKEQMSK